jgi:RNA polymerase sigma-70 factor, ECF subfamily
VQPGRGLRFFLGYTIMPAMKDGPPLRLVDGSQPDTSGEPTDDELMLLARANHQGAFETLVRRHQKLVLGIAIRYVGDATLGRDVAQDVFLGVWAERHRYQSRGVFRSYLVSCTLHRCQFVLRQRRTHERKHSELAQENAGSATAAPVGNQALHDLVEGERRKHVREKLALLPDKMREVLILRFTNDLSVEEIAKSTGLRAGTVKSHLFRGVARLHRLLGKDGL